jgi:hypothetical protein
MTINKAITHQEQMAELQLKLESTEFSIFQAERFLSAHPSHEPTLSRYNILCHSRSEVKAKIRRLRERMG